MMYIWVHGEWCHVNGIFLDAAQQIGTVKVFAGYMESENNVPDFLRMKKAQFWDFNVKQTEWTSMRDKKESICNQDKTVQHDSQLIDVLEGNKHCQFISSKQVAKIMKRGEPVYLALIRPTNDPAVKGLTQKTKFQQMKEKGPVRKAPPVAETRKRMCQNAPVDV